MKNPPSFKLLYLPFLAFQHVMHNSNVREQYNLATISRRTKCLVGWTHSKRHVNATVQFGTLPSFTLKDNTMGNAFTFTLYPLIPLIYPTLSTIKQQILFVMEVFNLRFFGVCFLYHYPVGLEFTIFSFLRQENLRLQGMYFSEKLDSEVYEFVLGDAQELRWAHPFTTDIQFESFMSCRTLFRPKPRCTAGELNQFLKKWIEGSRINTFYCQLMDHSEFLSIFDGIDTEPVEYVGLTENDVFGFFDPGMCFLVKQISGLEAVVYWDDDAGLILTTHFTFDFTFEAPALDRQPWENDDEGEEEDDGVFYLYPSDEYDEMEDFNENASEFGEEEHDLLMGYNGEDSIDNGYGVNGEMSSDEEEDDSSDGSTDSEDELPYANFDNEDSDDDDEGSETEEN